jgi:uncharacterized membrane protein YeiH
MPDPPVLLVLDLAGTFAFALNGALTAVRAVHVDIVGVITLGMITAVGGGIIRDVLLGALPPATFVDWRYLAVAGGGGLIAFMFSRWLDRVTGAIDLLDAAGLSLFAVAGASKALELGAGPAQAVILGAVTGVGGGTVRDVLIRRVPSVLSSGLYAIPALLGAALLVAADCGGVHQVLGAPAALCAAAVCFLIRVVGLRFGLSVSRSRASVESPSARRAAGGRSTLTTVVGERERADHLDLPVGSCHTEPAATATPGRSPATSSFSPDVTRLREPAPGRSGECRAGPSCGRRFRRSWRCNGARSGDSG